MVKVGIALGILAASFAAGALSEPASATAGCAFPDVSQPFRSFADTNPYFLAPGGNFEAGTSGWSLDGGAGLVAENESFYVGSTGDSNSLALPTRDAVVTTPTFCVTTDAPKFRMLIKNNGNKGYMDGQLAVYLNFTGANGKAQQVKIAALTSKKRGWTLSPQISFIQYISTPLKSGFANISFTIKPNDDHGSWQIDDIYVDPYCSK